MQKRKRAPEFLVDGSKVNLAMLKPWIVKTVHEFGLEDEMIINYIFNLLEGKKINKEEVQSQLSPSFKNAPQFMDKLWPLLISAQKSPRGVPSQFGSEDDETKRKAAADHLTSVLEKMRAKSMEEVTKRVADGKLYSTPSKESSKSWERGSRSYSGDRRRYQSAVKRSSYPGRRVFPSPDSHGSTLPRRHRSPSPRKHRFSFPEHHRSSYAVQRRFRRSHSRSPSRSVSPANRSFVSPASDSSGSRIKMKSPGEKASSRDEGDTDGTSPIARGSTSPRRRPNSGRSQSPTRSRSPIRSRSRSLRCYSPSRHGRSPSPQRSRSRSRSPVKRKSPYGDGRRYQSPVRSSYPGRRVSPSPDSRGSPLPRRHRSPSPRKHRFPFPEHHGSSYAVQRQSPVRVRRSHSRSPSRSVSPANRSFVSPASDSSGSRIKMKSPGEKARLNDRAERVMATPVQSKIMSPQRDHSDNSFASSYGSSRMTKSTEDKTIRQEGDTDGTSPIARGSTSPRRSPHSGRSQSSTRSRSPLRRRSRSPLRLYSLPRRGRSPFPRQSRPRSRSPVKRRSPYGGERRCQLPVKRRSPCSGRRVAPYPDRRGSPLPRRHRSPSPTRHRPYAVQRLSPVRRSRTRSPSRLNDRAEPVLATPVQSSEQKTRSSGDNRRKGEQSEHKSTGRGSDWPYKGKKQEPHDKPAGRVRDITDLGQKDTRMTRKGLIDSSEIMLEEANAAKRSPRKDSVARARDVTSYPADAMKSDEQITSLSKDTGDTSRPDALVNQRKKRKSPSVSSEVEDTKEAKRRKKETSGHTKRREEKRASNESGSQRMLMLPPDLKKMTRMTKIQMVNA